MKTVKLLETTWNKDCPLEVQEEIGELWGDYLGFGNDYYYWNTSLAELYGIREDGQFKVDQTIQYLEKHVSDPDEKILIHYWW